MCQKNRPFLLTRKGRTLPGESLIYVAMRLLTLRALAPTEVIEQLGGQLKATSAFASRSSLSGGQRRVSSYA